jgi:hypothetical protein
MRQHHNGTLDGIIRPQRQPVDREEHGDHDLPVLQHPQLDGNPSPKRQHIGAGSCPSPLGLMKRLFETLHVLDRRIRLMLSFNYDVAVRRTHLDCYRDYRMISF